MRSGGREAWALRVIEGEERGPAAEALRLLLSGLALIYSGGLKLYLAPYRMGLRKQARLLCPVVSVGNLTTGGAGKTPFTLWLCRRLQAQGLRPCILSRGYRGAGEGGAVIVSTPDEVLLGAREAGDEALLLASSLPGVPVLAGRDRRVTGRLAVERFAPDVIVLDDGMQFYQLHRDVEVVLLNAVRPFGNGRLLPRGLLREPPSHLARAGFVVLTHVDEVAGDQVAALKRRVAALIGPGRVAEAAYSAAGVRPLAGGETSPAASLAGRKVAAVSALGHPEGFEGLLERVGADLTLRRRFPDHHAITPDEMEQEARHAREAGAELLAVTEKDAVKLPVRDFALPVVVLSAELDIIGHEALDEAIRQALARAGSKA